MQKIKDLQNVAGAYMFAAQPFSEPFGSLALINLLSLDTIGGLKNIIWQGLACISTLEGT